MKPRQASINEFAARLKAARAEAAAAPVAQLASTQPPVDGNGKGLGGIEAAPWWFPSLDTALLKFVPQSGFDFDKAR